MVAPLSFAARAAARCVAFIDGFRRDFLPSKSVCTEDLSEMGYSILRRTAYGAGALDGDGHKTRHIKEIHHG
jgi:hypothetical protein